MMCRLFSRYVLAALAALFAGVTSLHAQPTSTNYPTKAIRIIVPFPPGDSLDTMSRLISPAFTSRLGQNVIVDNRPGAAGQLGLELGAHAPADGYTLIGGQGGNLVVQPHTYKKLPYSPLKDFVAVAVSTTNYLGIAINISV
ncbi:MAG TPA: tripartite tricarboxylate transporter substrate-binding protein, partial [Burkholderiales bacterium]|nr:tripartite tricarboxylate transporter substrate-binding protein [Burkholderiales bacterium]